MVGLRRDSWTTYAKQGLRRLVEGTAALARHQGLLFVFGSNGYRHLKAPSRIGAIIHMMIRSAVRYSLPILLLCLPLLAADPIYGVWKVREETRKIRRLRAS
jgi:hypothetical protein